jgi:hypothetical protein
MEILLIDIPLWLEGWLLKYFYFFVLISYFYDLICFIKVHKRKKILLFLVLFWVLENMKDHLDSSKIVFMHDWNCFILIWYFCKLIFLFEKHYSIIYIFFYSKDQVERWFKFKFLKVLVYFGYMTKETGDMIEQFQ